MTDDDGDIGGLLGRLYMLDASGAPVLCDDVLVWGEWFESADRHVEQTIVNERLRVSTVFLGIDQNHLRHLRDGGPQVPILWETMIFGDEGAPVLNHCERYASREAALQGHRRAVNVATRALQEFDARVAAWEQAKADGKFDGKLAKPPRL